MSAADGASAAGTAATSSAAPRLKIGVWVDDPFVRIDADFAARLRACGVTEAALMTNRMNATRSSPPWELRSPATTIVRAARTLREAGLEVVLTCWPRPARAQIAELHADMLELMRDTGSVALEVDAEANWTARFLEDFTTLRHAAEHLHDVLRDAAGGALVEMTTFAQHAENMRGAALAPLVDRVFPQAYSVNERGGKRVPYDHPFGPGNMQRLTYADARKTGARSIGLGLAAYEQRWPGHRPEDAMRVALEAARDLGVTHVRYWSSKWIVGAQAQAYARRAITGAAADVGLDLAART